MALFLDLLDGFLSRNKPNAQQQGINNSSVLGVSDNGIVLRLPDNSPQSQLASRVLGPTADTTTNPTKLNLDGLITRDGDNIEIDFTSLGGRKFRGTEAELANIRGNDLIDLVGNAAAQNVAGGTLSLPTNETRQNALPNLLGGQRDISSGLDEKLGSLFNNMDDSERSEFIELFRLTETNL